MPCFSPVNSSPLALRVHPRRLLSMWSELWALCGENENRRGKIVISEGDVLGKDQVRRKIKLKPCRKPFFEL